MKNNSKRITITVTQEMNLKLNDLKQEKYGSVSENEMIKELIDTALSSYNDSESTNNENKI